MAIIIPTPSESLALLNAGYAPDYTGLSLGGADDVLTDLAEAVLDIIEFTNLVIEPEILQDYLCEPGFYRSLNLEGGTAIESALAFGSVIAGHVSNVAAAEEADEIGAHLLIRSLRLIYTVSLSAGDDGSDQLDLDLIRLRAIEGHAADVEVRGIIIDDVLADMAFGLALVAYNMIRFHFADGASLDDNGQGFDAYLDAINTF